MILLDLYGKFGQLRDVEEVFDEMPEGDFLSSMVRL